MSNDERREHEAEPGQSELSAEDLDLQSAVELPDREAMTVIQPEPIFSVTPISEQPLDPGWGGERV